MPFLRPKRRVVRKRTVRGRRPLLRRKAVKPSSRNSIQVTGTTRVTRVPFASFLRTVLNYSSDNLSQTVTSPTSYQWAANSVFDPNFTGVGHQCLWYDQITPIYKRYRVNAVRVTLFGKQLTANIPGFISLYATRPGQNSYNSISTFIENKTPYKITRQQQLLSLSRSWKMHDILGISYQKWLADEDYTAAVNNNPALISKINTTFSPFDEASTLEFSYRITLAYDVTFYELQYPARS